MSREEAMKFSPIPSAIDSVETTTHLHDLLTGRQNFCRFHTKSSVIDDLVMPIIVPRIVEGKIKTMRPLQKFVGG